MNLASRSRRQQSLRMTSCRSLSILLMSLFALVVSLVSVLPERVPQIAWSIAQWTPNKNIAQQLQQKAWKIVEQNIDMDRYVDPWPIPTIDLGDATIGDPLQYLVSTYGKDWIERPLLLKRLWNTSSLEDPKRRLSIEGLRRDSQSIPYFTDARVYGALSPDGEAPIQHIMEGILAGMPYKIASQFYLQANPALLQEVAPPEILTKLFGNRFSKDRMLGHIRNPWNFLRGPLTIPLFIANGKPAEEEVTTCDATLNNSTSSTCTTNHSHPFTGLHCEPIGNVAVQLAGSKVWTLVDPVFSHALRPSVSPDSRGFFASWAPSLYHVPRYEHVTTAAGDAIWVPTWTWHRVDYVDQSVAMGASLFHFRPWDFLRRNPLYAFLLLPYLMGEFVGSKSQ